MTHITEQDINLYKRTPKLALDIETYDPELPDKGPGTHRGQGFICGVGIGAETVNGDKTHYLSFKHPDTPADERAKNRLIIADILKSDNRKLGANLKYDIEWLNHEGITVKGKYDDVQLAEPLLDEYARSYSLENLAKKYSVNRKLTKVLDDYNTIMGWQGKAITNIWRMPAKVAEEYCTNDLILPLEIFTKQKMALERQNLYNLYEMERDLTPLLLQLRRNGVRVDERRLADVTKFVSNEHWKVKQDLMSWAGYEINANSTTQLAKVFDYKGIPYPRKPPTEHMRLKGVKTGNPQLDKITLEVLSVNYPICKKILEYRHWDTMINLFLWPYSEMITDGRLYCQFHPLRSDSYGTVSGRFSSSKPNLQQVSAKSEDGEDGEYEDDSEYSEMKGKLLRQLFIPEEGHQWGKSDYSQIEYRCIAHYAKGKGAIELREQYNHDPKTDFHKYIMDLTGFDRRNAKRLNFGGAFGIGVQSAARLFGWTMEEAATFMETYHKAAPYIKETRNVVSSVASQRGYIFTILGRKARVHPSRKLHSMFNRLIQGSAADLFKAAMLAAYSAGVFNTLIPHLFVHDEVDNSVPKTKAGADALGELVYIMENTTKLDVPVKVDTHLGSNWAEAD